MRCEAKKRGAVTELVVLNYDPAVSPVDANSGLHATAACAPDGGAHDEHGVDDESEGEHVADDDPLVMPVLD